MLDNKTVTILEHVINYCDQIQEAIDEFNLTVGKIHKSHPCRNSIAMPLMQIGELVKKLSMDFRNKYPEVPWKEIAGARDYYAHGYQTMDPEMIWASAIHDTPMLKDFCQNIIKRTRQRENQEDYTR